MYQTSLEEMLQAARSGDYRRIPVRREILADIATPVQVLRRLTAVSGHCFLLESAEDNKQWGRYTFLGYDPAMELTCTDGHMTVSQKAERREFETEDPATVIRQVLKENRAPRLAGFPPLSGGLVGYFSYDFVKYGEASLELKAKDREGFRDVDLMLFDKLVAFDNYRQKILLIYNCPLPETDGKEGKLKEESFGRAYAAAIETLDEMERLVRFGREKEEEPGRLLSGLKPLFEKEDFCRKIERVKEYIREGDIFQLVLSNRLEAAFEGSLLDTYRYLRTQNPSPYMFYFSSRDLEIAGASPETLVKVEDGTAYTFPLAGTRPRGRDEREDRELEKELLSDEKELAEHNMLVDLGRNDLGRFCRFGTVEVEKYLSVERFSHVMHLGSTVRGRLDTGKTALDALAAVLPAGTLSGAPKIRACQIIDELENDKRGIYGGAVGYLDFAGNMDTCIAIRLAYRKNGRVFVRSGAGIVADSVPEKEYQECANKARAVVEALRAAQGGTR
ncbi:MAG: anthranilate synthase component I [Eubacteriales bacterium]|nr:anthranilate synthase component I [Eubacteriales bacterium]